MEKWLKDIWPIMDVENNCILSKRGDITIVFKVNLPEIFTLSLDDYNSLHQAFVKAIKILPENCIFHKQDWFIQEQYKSDFAAGEESLLNHSSDLFFNERPFLHHDCFIYLVQIPKTNKHINSISSSILKCNFVPDETIDTNRLRQFEDVASQFQHILLNCGVHVDRMQKKDLVSSAESVGLIERYSTLSGRNDSPLIKDICFDEGVQVGDKHCELYSMANVADLPSSCATTNKFDKYSTDKSKFHIGFTSPIGLLMPCNHIYNQYVIVSNIRSTIKRLESKRLRLQSLSAYSRENAIARDAVNDFLNEYSTEGRMPVKAHLNLLVWTNDRKELSKIKSLVSSKLAQMEIVAKQESVGAPQVFWAGIPGNSADIPINDTFDTFAEQAACFLNLETNYQSSLSAVGIRLGDRLTGKPIHVDISDEPIVQGVCTNRNKFILGPSGSGKSFFTNHMIRSYYEHGAHIVLVDVGHSYQGLCELVNGYYFTYSEKKPIQFNPFFIGRDDILDTEKKESIKTLLLALWKKDHETFNRSEYVALSNAVQLYYDDYCMHNIVFPCFNSFYEFLRDEFVQVLTKDNVRDKEFDVSNFLYVLRPYYNGGEFDYLLNAEKNLHLLSERLIVFELDNIKDHPILFPVVTIIIMEVFISKMRKLKGIRKMILIEEAWKAIAKEGMAEYIKYLFKTVRKFFGEAIVVTQDVEDILSSPIVKQAIINNSDCKILLDQSKYQNKFDQIQELLGLTDNEKTLVLSINKANDPFKKYKEVFISLGGVKSRVYRTEVSLEEYLAYTTEEAEKMKVQEYARKHGSIGKGLKALANDIRMKAI